MSILLINGPNLNLLGQREPQVYGTDTLADIEQRAIALAKQSDVEVECFQSNIEGVLIDKVHEAAASGCQFIIINPGAFTHTSIALRDALLGVNIPCIEVHLSNVYKREAFRQVSYLSDIAIGVITGLGAKGYDYAIDYAIDKMKKS